MNLAPSTHVLAQQFTTGTNSQGYVLKTLTFRINGISSGASPKVSIYTSVGNKPGTELYTFAAPSSGAGEKTVAVQANATLAASTPYFIVFEDTDSSTGNWSVALSASFSSYDSDSLTDWSLAGRVHSSDGGTTWGSINTSQKIAVRLARAADSTDVTIEAEHDTIGAGMEHLNFTLTRTGAVTDALSVTVTIAQDETWLFGSDLSHTVTFGAGDDEATLRVTAIRFSPLPEQPGDLTATVSGTGISGGSVTVRVVSIAGPPVTVTLDKASYTFAENAPDADVVIDLVATLDAAYPRAPTGLSALTVATRQGTATLPDYEPMSESIPIHELTYHRSMDTDPYVATVSLKKFGFKIRDDKVDEADDETFYVVFGSSPGLVPGWFLVKLPDGSTCGLATSGCNSEVGWWPVTITDDDAPPELAFEAAPTEIAAADDAATDAEENVATVTIESTNGTLFEDDQTLTLTFGGTATYGTHYTVELPDADPNTTGHQVAYPGEGSMIAALEEDAVLVLSDHLPLEAPELAVKRSAPVWRRAR